MSTVPLSRIRQSGRRARTTPPAPAEGYQPPYGNAALDEFAWHVAKYLQPEALLQKDAELDAGRGRLFRCDFLIECALPAIASNARRRVGVQIGWARSLAEHQQRRRRDAATIASGVVDVLYRIGGPDLPSAMNDALHLMATWEHASGAGRHVADIFSVRGRVNLARLASPAASGLTLLPDSAAALLPAEAPAGDGAVRTLTPALMLRRFDRRFPAWWAPHVPEYH